MKPQKEATYSINKLSELTGADRRVLKKRLQGVPPDEMAGGNPLYALSTVTAVIRKHREASVADTGSGSRDSLSLRKLVAQCGKIESENARIKFALETERGLYWKRADVEAKMKGEVERARFILIAKLRDEAPPKLAGLTVPEIAEKMDRIIEDVLKALRG